VSNAGETMRGTIEQTPLAEFERLYQINTLGALRVTRPCCLGCANASQARSSSCRASSAASGFP
jgi:NAD(P)-dependent dehydrogenase (short-subunit alcohol dehydrogenase family)